MQRLFCQDKIIWAWISFKIDLFINFQISYNSPVYISPSPLFLRVLKYIVCRAMFHKLTEIKVNYIVGKPHCLVDIVSYYHDSIIILEFQESLLDMLRRDRVKR